MRHDRLDAGMSARCARTEQLHQLVPLDGLVLEHLRDKSIERRTLAGEELLRRLESVTEDAPCLALD
jgi:hypothetical protein